MNKLIITNWKMELDYQESINLAKQYKKYIKRSIVVCPSFISIHKLIDIFRGSKIKVGSQDSSMNIRGAYTGEVSALDLSNIGVKYSIIGHSERRLYYGETNKIINKKIKVSLDNNIIPIVCFGESREVRNKKQTRQYLRRELRIALKDVIIKNNKQLIIAYEPLWAIGKRAIDSREANNIQLFIKQEARKMLHRDLNILYGGSIRQNNALDFLSQDNIDGLLIGGASLNIKEFSKICQF